MGENMDLNVFKEQRPDLFERYAKLPALHNERTYTLDNIEQHIHEVEDLLDELPDAQEGQGN